MDLILDKIDENFSNLVLKDESFLCLTPFTFKMSHFSA